MMAGQLRGPVLARVRWHMPWGLLVAQQRHQYPCVADDSDGDCDIKPEVLEPHSIGSSISVVDPTYANGPGIKISTLITLRDCAHVDA